MEKKDLFAFILSGVVCFFFFAYLLIILFVVLPEGNEAMVNTVGGALLVAFATIISYWFGSSKGSADKTKLLK